MHTPSFSLLPSSSIHQRNFSSSSSTTTNVDGDATNADERIPVIDADEYAEEIQAVKDEYAWRKARKQAMIGIVQSNKMDKSITILCYRKRFISKYGVHIRRKKRVMAHDEEETALPGDVVRVVRSDLGARLVPTVIHQDESVKEALAFDQLVLQYAPHSEATRDLSQAAAWLSKKLAPVFKAQKAVQK